MTIKKQRMHKQVLRYLKGKVLPQYVPTKLGGAIVNSMLERPDDWKLGDHTIDHIPSGIEIWLANEITNRRIYKAPKGINVEDANQHISYGDQVAIEEVVKRLRERTRKPIPLDTIVGLLNRSTTD